LNPDHLQCLWNLAITCLAAERLEKCQHWAEVALPLYGRHLKLHPDNENTKVNYACLLHMSGRIDEARVAAMALRSVRDGASLYNTASLLAELGDYAEALLTCRKALEAGYCSFDRLNDFLSSEGVVSLRNTPEYDEVKEMVEKIEREADPSLPAQ
jgi:tetratricopeptide (TPR) repeat protein